MQSVGKNNVNILFSVVMTSYYRRKNVRRYHFGARFYDPAIMRWYVPDPLAEKHYAWTPYAYVYNNPMNLIDPFGLDSVYVLDQATRPLDNGTPGESYTASIYVVQNGTINGPYSGSSYPNSISNTDNNTTHNTLKDGEHLYNNASGHDGGDKQGLNIVNEAGERKAPGIDPNGNDIPMTVVNVHEGTSDLGNAKSRGSWGCITIKPSDASAFMGNFDWSGASGNTGNSTGTLILQRGADATATSNFLQSKQDFQKNPMQTIPNPVRSLFGL